MTSTGISPIATDTATRGPVDSATTSGPATTGTATTGPATRPATTATTSSGAVDSATDTATRAGQELPRRAHRQPYRRMRRPIVALLSALVAVLALVGVAGPASANVNTSMCLHGARTYVWQTLPANPSAGTVLDLYLYRYTSSGWAYTGSAIRLRGTTGGYWLTSGGYMTQRAYFSVRPNSGYYLLRAHAFNTYASQWAWIYGYADDMRGNTTYCLS